MTTIKLDTYIYTSEVLLLNLLRTARKFQQLTATRCRDGHLRLMENERVVFYIIDDTLFDGAHDWPLAIVGTNYKNHIVTPLGDELGLDFSKAYQI